jgi:3D (Asp-Asp-Asp) domain-containing protein
MNGKIVLGFAKVVLLSVCLSVSASRAQEPITPKAQAAAEKPVTAYRLDFTVTELEDGKKINTRQYSMNLNTDDANAIKIGTRVPVEAKQGEFQYIDVGTDIWSRLKERDNGLLLEVRCEISNFAIPDQANRTNSMPLIRQLKINASTVVLPGKPIIVGSVDDPNSKRQFQLEVATTKLR